MAALSADWGQWPAFMVPFLIEGFILETDLGTSPALFSGPWVPLHQLPETAREQACFRGVGGGGKETEG